jgi:hypothetical protein
MRLNTRLYHKLDAYRTEHCEADRIIEVSGFDFARLYAYPLEDYDFIAQNKEGLRRDEKGVSHCLLVLGKGADDGILLCPEGYDYARYSTHIPNARQIVAQMKRQECLKKLEKSLNNAADDLVSRALAYDGEGPYRALLDELCAEHSIDGRYLPLLLETLGERAEAFEFEETGGEIFAYRNQQEQARALPDPSPLPFSPERMEQILDKALDWIGELDRGAGLYNTLAERLGMSNEEISAAGFETLKEYFEDPGEDENAGMTME